MKQTDRIIGKTISKLTISKEYWNTELYFRFSDNSFASFTFPISRPNDDEEIDIRFNTRVPPGILLGVGLITKKEYREIDTYNRIKEKYNLA